MNKRRTLSPTATRPVEIFVSYSHQNAAWFARLQPVLKFTEPSANVAHIWHDQELKAGDRWDNEIRAALKAADIFVCLVSYESVVYSDYITQVELPAALARAKKGEMVIVPIVLYPMNLQEDCPALHVFNPLPVWGKCWYDYEQNGGHYQAAHKPIRDGLRQAIEKVQAKR